MGTTASSLFLRSDESAFNVQSVRDAIKNVLNCDLKVSAVDEISEDGLIIASAGSGWIFVTDDSGRIPIAAAKITSSVPSVALLTEVHRSDSWSFRLFESGNLIDSFRPPTAADSLRQAISHVNVSEIERRIKAGEDPSRIADEMRTNPSIPELAFKSPEQIQEEFEAFAARMKAEAPDTMRKIAVRIEAGTATPKETKMFESWQQQQVSKFQATTFRNPYGDQIAKATGADQKEVQKHVDSLKSFLIDGANESDLRAVLESQFTHAEMGLSLLLTLFGIEPTFGCLVVNDVLCGDFELEAGDFYRVTTHR